jgi:hypothetical protein
MLNFEDIGKPVAIIQGGTLDKKKIYLAIDEEDKEEVKKPFYKINLSKTGGKFEVLPNDLLARECGYICGQSGCGKSFFVSQYIEKYKKKHKNNDIYLFSEVDDDEKLNKFNPIKIKLDDELLNDNFDYKDFPNSLVIFDDIDSIKDKKIKNEVYKILDSLLTMGRHNGASVLVTNHTASDRERTKKIFNESHFITYFPFGGSQKQLKYMLESHADLDKNVINYNKKLKSRWICVMKNYPTHTISEKEIYINE